jgi:arylsulfatase A
MFSFRAPVIALVLAGGFAASAHAADATRPNVVFILVDDMGYADLRSYGAKDIQTPNIDRLAREGVRFTDFYANAPVCTPTRAAFITGRWQQRVGLEWAMGFSAEQKRRAGDTWVPVDDKLALGLPTTERSIARMLKDAGYATAAFGKWHLGFKPEYGPIAHGFDEFFGLLLGHADYYTKHYKDGTYELVEGTEFVKKEGYTTDLFNQRAVEFIGRQRDRPFFLYVPYNAVHWPFQPPDQPDSRMDPDDVYKGTRQDYKAMLERVDLGVGMILAALEKQGQLDNTLVILSSDNGGERLSDNTPLFNHKTTLWEGGIRVPCVMRWPRGLPAGALTRQAAITMDLTATILAAAGAEQHAGRTLDGIDLLPMLRGERPPVERMFCWRVDRSDRRQKAIRYGKWKYVQDGMVEMLFDLEADIGERRDLGYQHPEVLRDLQKRLADWEAEMAKSAPAFVVN